MRMLIVSLVLSFLIAGSYGQGELFFFDWPGPLAVPVDIFAIQPPDKALIVFANSGTDRQLRIGEGVFTTFNCSVVVENLEAMGVAPTSINTIWLLKKFDTENMPLAGDPQPVVDDDMYDIFGDHNEFLNITDPGLPTIAAEGESGIYTCRACGDTLIVGGTPMQVCLNSSTTLLIAGNPPVIDETPGERLEEEFVGFRIGNDFCAQSPLQQNGIGIDILCVQDPAFTIPDDPPPVATWSFNGAPVVSDDNPFQLNNDLRGGVGTNGQLSIINLSPTSAYVGEYMCNLTTIHGQDQSTSRLAVSDLTASAGIDGRSDDGCARFGITATPNSFCAEVGEDATITCSASGGYTISGPRGQVQDQSFTINSITTADSGVYTCSSGPPCNDTMSFIITAVVTGPPVIQVTPPVIEPNRITHSIGQDICINGKNDPAEIILLCGHSNANKVSPEPAAQWTFPTTQAQAASTISNSPDRFGTDTQVLIDNDGDPISIVSDLEGEYTCILSNSLGSVNSSTLININPRIIMGDGRFSQSELEVVIGNSTCEFVGADRSRISCNEVEGDIPTSWTFNGAPLPDTGRTLENQGPGSYTCTKMNRCGTENATTTILGVPSIPDPGPTPTDGAGVVFEVGQSVCIDPQMSGSAQIECPVPAFSDPRFTSVVWTRAGDPSFSFQGSIISLDRSDLDLADMYTCRITTGGAAQQCGQDTSDSSVNFQSRIVSSSGFVSGSPNEITIGASTCEPPNGQSLRIRCQTTPINRTISWTLDGAPVSGGEFIDVTDPGNYTCSGLDGCNNVIMGSSLIIAETTVNISASISGLSDNGCSRFDNAPATADICPLEGETLVIECVASSGSYSISIQGNTQSTDTPLTLSPFADSQAGIYMCTGSDNPCGTPTDSLEVFAGGLPPIILPVEPTDPFAPPPFLNISIGQDACLPTGESLNINCLAAFGSPPIQYAWRRGQNQTVFSTAITIAVSEPGVYTCTATNVFGSISLSSRVVEDIDLVFRLDPSSSQQSRCSQLRVPPSNTDLCFFTGDAANFTCASRVSMTPGVILPAARVTNLQETDTMFTCTLSSACNNASSSLILLVQEPARINRMSPLPPSSDTVFNIGAGRPDEPIEVQENITVRLHCPFTGLDQPSTRWVRVNRDRTTSDVVAMPPDIVLINDSNNVILELNNFNEDLEGTFRCITDNNAGDDDGDVVLRFEPPEPGEWTTTPWSECDPDCHRGTRMRQVTCVGVSTRLALPDNRCTEVKPDTTEQCDSRGPCFLDPIWVPQEWSLCSKPCGGGYRIRNIICQIPRTGERVDVSRCDQQARPNSFELCNQHPCCTGDNYPAFCHLIRGTIMCRQEVFKTACCWSCR